MLATARVRVCQPWCRAYRGRRCQGDGFRRERAGRLPLAMMSMTDFDEEDAGLAALAASSGFGASGGVEARGVS